MSGQETQDATLGFQSCPNPARFPVDPRTPAQPDTIIGMMRGEPKKYQFTPDYKLVCTLKDTSFEGILEMAKSVLKRLVPPVVQ